MARPRHPKPRFEVERFEVPIQGGDDEGPLSHRRAAALLKGIAVAAALAAFSGAALAADPFKIGLILPMTGPFASTGKQIEAAAKLYMAKHGDTVAGRKIELIVKDDTGLAPETTKRIAQELVVQDKVNVLAGFGLTPLALAAAPVATEAKVPMVVMAAATGMIPTRSPYIVRTGFTLPQVTGPIAEWALKNKIKRVVTMVTDYGSRPRRREDVPDGVQGRRRRDRRVDPDAAAQSGLRAVPAAREGCEARRAVRIRAVRRRPRGDEAVRGTRPQAGGDQADRHGRRHRRRPARRAWAQPAVGIITSFHYSAAHDSPENKAYVDAFMKANNGMRPNFHSVGGYDGMHLIYEALKKAGPNATGDQLLEAMKGMKWMSPRGPMSIDPATRQTIQNVYLREVKMVNGQPWNVEFDKIENVKDPG